MFLLSILKKRVSRRGSEDQIVCLWLFREEAPNLYRLRAADVSGFVLASVKAEGVEELPEFREGGAQLA